MNVQPNLTGRAGVDLLLTGATTGAVQIWRRRSAWANHLNDRSCPAIVHVVNSTARTLLVAGNVRAVEFTTPDPLDSASNPQSFELRTVYRRL
ncbi:MAG: hypothetical protein DLM60_10870 [Pseudonocardiales bacterium]|nr:MAG: hypothetical protein DLM60_10870 [Pseudonocardiales bacterium]